jgi:putative integral membrane protein (TIGR02587 family)
MNAEWKQEFDQFVRLISGAFLFGIPLLYTMEMWWIGKYAEPWKLAAFLGLAFLVGVLLVYFSDQEGETSLFTSFGQSVEALAVGIIASLAVLFVLNRIGPGIPLDAAVGMVIIQTVPLSIGAAAAHSILAFGERKDRQGEVKKRERRPDLVRVTLNDLGATLAGGIFIGLPLAPTDEIPQLAAEMGYWHEIALVGFSLIITYAIVFESGFNPQDGTTGSRGPFQHPITETVVAYLVSLVVAFAALYLFDRVDFSEPLDFVLSHVLVLGLPATIGGAAGRLVI